MKHSTITLSIIICTRNRHQLLVKCLESIASNTIIPQEIIIVDQSDDDETKKSIAPFQTKFSNIVRYIKSTRIGKSYGLNLAISQSKGDCICLTDDDCTLTSHWFENIVAIMRDAEVACVTGRVLAEVGSKEKEYLNLVRSDIPKKASWKTNPWRLGCIGCNMVVRKDIFSIAGGFDENLGPGSLFKSSMDGDMVYRILKKKRCVVFSPLLTVYHSSWREGSDNTTLRYNYALGLGAFAAKYVKEWDFYPFFMILQKFIQKFRRMCVGILLFQKNRVTDGYIHIDGISHGFFKRLFL